MLIIPHIPQENMPFPGAGLVALHREGWNKGDKQGFEGVGHMYERRPRGTVNDARLSWIPGIMLPAQIWCFYIPWFPHPREGQV